MSNASHIREGGKRPNSNQLPPFGPFPKPRRPELAKAASRRDRRRLLAGTASSRLRGQFVTLPNIVPVVVWSPKRLDAGTVVKVPIGCRSVGATRSYAYPGDIRATVGGKVRHRRPHNFKGGIRVGK